MRSAALVTLALLALLAALGARADGGGDALCRTARSCGECIRLHPSCKWCIRNDNQTSGCMSKVADCAGEIEAPSSKSEVLKNIETEHEVIPQRFGLAMRVGETKEIKFTYRKKEDYPIDLYCLMDLSSSMKEHKEKLASLSESLATAMSKVTSNFRLGFGSFVDKLALPFVDFAGYNRKFARPYSFKHHLPLQEDPKKFSKRVRDEPLSTNVDTPEGGLDALMQAMVCDEIGWRKTARRLIVFSTDAAYHFAGDGKLAGVVEPNNETCQLQNNEYTHSLEYDYPSISQIKRKVEEKEILLIFAVTKNMEVYYSRLSERITGSQLKFLDDPKSNIAEAISDAYKKFDKKIELSDNVAGQGISLTYEAKCPGHASYTKTKLCPEGVVPKKDIPFRINITVPACPHSYREQTWKTNIAIRPVGTTDGVEIDLEVHCGCACEQAGNKHYQERAPKCSYRGTLTCGICRCEGSWIGDVCNCTRASDAATQQNDCRGAEGEKDCSGRGSCVCGQCLCDKRKNPKEKITGRYCQCDNYSCNRHQGIVCSGPGRGRCECGKCVCLPGWSGDACQCRHRDNCIAPGDDRDCSGNGTCVCGGCRCAAGFSGKYCGDKVGQPGGRCTELKDCVECTVHGTGKFATNNCSTCKYTKPVLADVIKEEELDSDERHCRLPDDSGCTFVFKYLDVEHNLNITAERKKQCPEPLNIIALGAGVAGSILFIGLLTLLIWKLVTLFHDKREFARYQQELSRTKWAALDNPLHQQATTTVQNPTFRPY